jgi:tetratricopeptide (TPR) repeat protein
MLRHRRAFHSGHELWRWSLALIALIAFTAAAPQSLLAKRAKPQVQPAVEEAQPEAPPAAIPEPVIDALAAGDIRRAIIAMQEEPPSPKLNYLMREATAAATFELQKKPEKSDAHKSYQNVAIAYHNLFLFLKSHDIDQKEFYKQARRFYGKARSSATVLHQSECDLLEAALLASGGEREKAAKLFAKVDEAAMRGDFESVEYLAAYHAAAGNADEALASLEEAHKINPERTLTWLSVGDDFTGLKDDARYQALVASWHISKADRELTRALPKHGKPKTEGAGPEKEFAPQKMMEHASKEQIKKPRRSDRHHQGKHTAATSKSKAAAKGKETVKSTPSKTAPTKTTTTKGTAKTTSTKGTKKSSIKGAQKDSTKATTKKSTAKTTPSKR